MSAFAAVLLMNFASVPINVTFNIVPPLKAPGTPPRLRVTIGHVGPKPIPLMRFQSDACFAHFFLELPLILPDGSKPQAASCPIRSWPGVKGTLAPNELETRELDLSQIFPSVKWGRGRYLLSPAWSSEQLESYFGGEYATESTTSSVNQPFFELAPSLGKVRIERGKEVTLPDGARLSFTAHGHKRTKEGGPASPLIIHGGFAAPKEKTLTTFETRVFPDERSVFTIGDGFTFELVKHEYDGWMELVYFGRL
jgi:hypothetical protein